MKFSFSEEWKKNLISVREGESEIYSFNPDLYKDGGSSLTKAMPVFYNPIMTVNRDLSLLLYKTYKKQYGTRDTLLPFSVCDSMAATGIRTIRLAKFLTPPFVILANDLNPLAIKLIMENLEKNKMTFQEFREEDSITKEALQQDPKIYISNKDCRILFSLLTESKNYFTIIDVDPFGSPNIFIESAIKALKLGGLLGITATDTAVLFGIKKEACLRKYNVRTMRTSFLKEMGIRALLYFIASRAHPFMDYIEPILSYSSDHYIRVFVRIKKGKKGVNDNLNTIGFIEWCKKCDWRKKIDHEFVGLENICPRCGKKTEIIGPLWLGTLHSYPFIESLERELQEFKERKEKRENKIVFTYEKKIRTLIEKFKEEAKLSQDVIVPWYYNLHKIADRTGVSIKKTKEVIKRLEEQGFKAIRTHFDPRSIKTTATIQEIEEILKE